MARALASKIALAVRKDVFSGDFDDSIKKEFNEKVEEITKANPFPKRTKTSKKRKKRKKKRGKDLWHF